MKIEEDSQIKMEPFKEDKTEIKHKAREGSLTLQYQKKVLKGVIMDPPIELQGQGDASPSNQRQISIGKGMAKLRNVNYQTIT